MSIENENNGAAPAAASTTDTSNQTSVTSDNTGAGSTTGMNGAASTTTSDWRANLAEEYKSNKSLANYKTMDDFVKSHLHLEKMLGQKQSSVVGEPAQTVYEPDAYKYTAEEGKPAITPEVFDKVSAKAHELKIAPAQFQELVKTFLESEDGFMAAGNQANDVKFKEAHDSLVKEWGVSYQEKVDKSHGALELFGGAYGLNSEDFSGLSPEKKIALTKMFADIGGKIGETTHGKQGGEKNNLTIEQAKAKIAEIRNDSNHPYHKGDASARAEMAKLYLAADGTE